MNKDNSYYIDLMFNQIQELAKPLNFGFVKNPQVVSTYTSYISFNSIFKLGKIKGKNCGRLVLVDPDTPKFKKLVDHFKKLDFIIDLEQDVKYLDNPLQVHKMINFKYYTYQELMLKKVNCLLNNV